MTELVESGKLNLLATFGAERDEQFPNTPTPTEVGYPSVVVVGWAGLLAPAGTPTPIVDKLYAGMAKALAMPDVKDAILKQGSKAVSSSKSRKTSRATSRRRSRSSIPSSRLRASKDRSERMSYVKKTHRFGLLTPSSNTTQEPEFSAALPPTRLAAHRARGLSRHHAGGADALRAGARDRRAASSPTPRSMSSCSRRPRRRSPRARATTAS